MLRVSEGKPIAAFVPCPECQALSVVHFPKGGKRQNTPYISCIEHKTIQTAGLKDYVSKYAVSSLSLYAAKYKADVSNEQEQLDANKYPINAELLQRIEGEPVTTLEVTEPKPEPEIEEIEPDELEQHFNAGSSENLTIDESGEVIDDKEDKTPKQGGSMMPLLVILGVVIIVGGGFYLMARKRATSQGGDDE